MNKFVLMLLLSMVGTSVSYSQRTITGKITNSKGEPLIGANVLVKGTTAGTIADPEGMFSLTTPSDTGILVFSYTGFDSKEIDIGPSDRMDVTLNEGLLMEEILVTAFGIDRNARDISYANQTVKSDELLSSPNKNALEALRGKVAGVRISEGSGSVGASTKIVFRGEGSLTGNNNALIVVDGIPIDNAASRSGDPDGLLSNIAAYGYADYGNRFNDINPADIESVTVLKGPSATSLYGSRGASGVLLITTKNGSGKDGKFEVGINSSFSAERAYVLMQRQDKYGQGYGIPFQDTYGRDSGENFSWGAPVDGVVHPWTSPVDADGDGDLEWLSRPYSAVPNQLQDFFDTGHTLSNGFYFSGSKTDFTYYVSYSNSNQQGILQNTDYGRNTFKLASSAKLTDRLTSDFSINYSLVDVNTLEEGYYPFIGQNAYASALQTAINIPLSELKDYKSPYHSFTGYYGSYTANPYFVLNEYVNNGKISNLLGNVHFKYKLLDHWNLEFKMGLNNVRTNIKQAIPQYAYTDHFFWGDDDVMTLRGDRAHNEGFYAESALDNTNIDLTGITNVDIKLSSRIKADVAAGYNFFQRQTRRLDGQTVGGIVIPGFYSLSNSAQSPIAGNTLTKYRIIGGFANLRLGLDEKLFLEYSARNDWSSTLPKENNSFFYQAVGASAIVSDLLNIESKKINYLKLRASYGTTGKDAPLYLLNSVYIGNPTIPSYSSNHDILFPVNGQAGYTLGNTIGNPNLKPELTTTFEAGIDASFFNDRLAFEYTYYNANHSNQIVIVTLPNSTGFTQTVKNLGEMKNSGHELSLTIRPLYSPKKNGFKWELGMLYAKNKNEVTRINPENGQDELVINSIGINQVAAVGHPYGSFKGQVRRMNDQGQIVVDGNGIPLLSDDLEFLGSYQPDWTGSLSNTIDFAGFSLYVLVDVSQGGKFLSLSKNYTDFNGTSLTSLIGDRNYFIVPNSVVENADGTFSENTTPVAPYDYITNAPVSIDLIDASYIKLREISLKYQLPKSFTNKIAMKGGTIGVFAKNLKFWLPDENTFADPEVNGPDLTGNATGIETTQTPPSKSYGVTLNLIF